MDSELMVLLFLILTAVVVVNSSPEDDLDFIPNVGGLLLFLLFKSNCHKCMWLCCDPHRRFEEAERGSGDTIKL